MLDRLKKMADRYEEIQRLMSQPEIAGEQKRQFRTVVVSQTVRKGGRIPLAESRQKISRSW